MVINYFLISHTQIVQRDTDKWVSRITYFLIIIFYFPQV